MVCASGSSPFKSQKSFSKYWLSKITHAESDCEFCKNSDTKINLEKKHYRSNVKSKHSQLFSNAFLSTSVNDFSHRISDFQLENKNQQLVYRQE